MKMRGARPIPNAYIRCLVTTGDAARRVGVSSNTIRSAIRDGRLPAVETPSQAFSHLGDVWYFMSQRSPENNTMQPIEKDTTTSAGRGDRQGLRDNLWRLYRVSLQAYDRAVESQDGRCAVCRELPPEGQRLCVDHDHETGEIRGLLCAGCNSALGHMRERPDAICRLAAYADYCARLRARAPKS